MDENCLLPKPHAHPRKALGTRENMVQAHMFADDAADDHTRAMVYGEVLANLRTGMDFDAGGRISNFRNHSGYQRRAQSMNSRASRTRNCGNSG